MFPAAPPITDEDRSVVVVYNGEIYNYPELPGRVLDGSPWPPTATRRSSPHLYEDEGIGFAARLNGIFAFALFDRPTGGCSWSTTRSGSNPLFIRDRRAAWLSGPKPRRSLASGLVDAGLDQVSLHLSINVRYVPGDRTFFRSIRRLPPGHVLEFTEGRAAALPVPRRSIGLPIGPTRAEWIEGIQHHYGLRYSAS